MGRALTRPTPAVRDPDGGTREAVVASAPDDGTLARMAADHVDAELARLDRFAELLDGRWRIFGLEVGLDPLIGLVPVVGDTLGAVLSAIIVWRAARLGARRRTLVWMALNIAIDWAVGELPVLGDLADAVWRANRRNVVLLRRDLEARGLAQVVAARAVAPPGRQTPSQPFP